VTTEWPLTELGHSSVVSGWFCASTMETQEEQISTARIAAGAQEEERFIALVLSEASLSKEE
jgi:hypothetical protein